MVRLLLKRNGVKPNIQSERPEDLMLSLRRNRDTDPNLKTYHSSYIRFVLGFSFGEITPLSIVSREGKEAIVRLLLKRDDIDSNMMNSSGRSLL